MSYWITPRCHNCVCENGGLTCYWMSKPKPLSQMPWEEAKAIYKAAHNGEPVEKCTPDTFPNWFPISLKATIDPLQAYRLPSSEEEKG